MPGDARFAGPRRWLSPNVVAFGLASLFSDAGHETATAVLPLFLTAIGGSAAALGVIEGVADGLSTGAKLWSGWYSDGLRTRKPLGVAGYAATGIGMSAFALASTPFQVFLIRALSWIGRGARGPVRDAMLAGAVPPGAVGKAFGFHRAMDTAGAVIGPLVALLLMGVLSYRAVFVLTLIPGVLSIVAFGAIREPSLPRARSSLKASLVGLPPDFRRFLVAVGIFGLGDFARSLLILRASQIAGADGFASPASTAVALYVFHNLVQALASYAIGVLATRFGSRPILAGGYVAFAAMALGFIALPESSRVAAVVALFALAGAALAAEEVLEGTVAAELLPERLRGTGFGALAAVNGTGDLVASVVVGSLWAWVSPRAGFAYSAATSLAGAIALLRLAGRRR